mmetsp:Transcript_21240/g.36511  ORF Transcript_21240/g.36511 Transcript_21240/m.36511 type:complete len:192 (+) Transcript_21240:1344-1919(+)
MSTWNWKGCCPILVVFFSAVFIKLPPRLSFFDGPRMLAESTLPELSSSAKDCDTRDPRGVNKPDNLDDPSLEPMDWGWFWLEVPRLALLTRGDMVDLDVFRSMLTFWYLHKIGERWGRRGLRRLGIWYYNQNYVQWHVYEPLGDFAALFLTSLESEGGEGGEDYLHLEWLRSMMISYHFSHRKSSRFLATF